MYEIIKVGEYYCVIINDNNYIPVKCLCMAVQLAESL